MEKETSGDSSRDSEAQEHQRAMDEIHSKLPEDQETLLEMLAKAQSDYDLALEITDKTERVAKFNEAQDRMSAISRKLRDLGHDINS